MTRKWSASFSPPNLLQGLLGGLLAGMAWRLGEYQLVFGLLVYMILAGVRRNVEVHRALKEIEARMQNHSLVIVEVSELKKFGLRAVDGGVEKEVEDV